MVPVQVEDFALAAAGQQQEADRHCRIHDAVPALFWLVQHPAETAELFVGQEAFVAALPVRRDLPARVAALRDQLPLLCRPIDPERHFDRPVRRRRRLFIGAPVRRRSARQVVDSVHLSGVNVRSRTVAVWIPEGVPVVQGQTAGPGGLEFDVQCSFRREPDNRIVEASTSLGPVAVRITLLRAFD